MPFAWAATRGVAIDVPLGRHTTSSTSSMGSLEMASGDEPATSGPPVDVAAPGGDDAPVDGLGDGVDAHAPSSSASSPLVATMRCLTAPSRALDAWGPTDSPTTR